MRRSHVNWLRLAGADAVVARDIVGHADDSMRALYSIVVPEERLRAARAVAQMLDGGSDSGAD